MSKSGERVRTGGRKEQGGEGRVPDRRGKGRETARRGARGGGTFQKGGKSDAGPHAPTRQLQASATPAAIYRGRTHARAVYTGKPRVTQSPEQGCQGEPCHLHSWQWLPKHRGDTASRALERGHAPGWPTTSCVTQADLTRPLDTDHKGLLHGLPASWPVPCTRLSVDELRGGGAFQKANVITPPSLQIPPWLPIAPRVKL